MPDFGDDHVGALIRIQQLGDTKTGRPHIIIGVYSEHQDALVFAGTTTPPEKAKHRKLVVGITKQRDLRRLGLKEPTYFYEHTHNHQTLSLRDWSQLPALPRMPICVKPTVVHELRQSVPQEFIDENTIGDPLLGLDLNS